MINGVLVERDPDAYKRFLHNKARFEKYGSGQRMDLDMKPPAPKQVVKFQFTSEQCRMLAEMYHDMAEMGLVPCGEED